MLASSCEELFEIRPARFGKGLFSKKLISANIVICTIQGVQISFEDTLQLGEKECNTLQVDINKYIICEPPFLFSNHSCEPNCAINENLEMYTLQEVHKDEELVWDYSTSMLERHWILNCECGSKLCRTLITDFDMLPIWLQEKYFHNKIVFPFIVQKLHLATEGFNKCA